jgi:PAS domain S-box-containing protein
MAARKQAEAILEQKAIELYQANQALRSLNESLEHTIESRTADLTTEQVRLRALILNLDSGVLLESASRHILLVNQEFCDLFGIPAPPAALVGMDCSSSAEDSKAMFVDSEGFVSRIKEILLLQEIVLDEELLLRDGRVFKRSYIPVFSGLTYMGHLWKYRDATIEHEQGLALRRSEEKYRGIIENMDLGLMEVDNNECITKPYPRFCSMVGYVPEELIGKNASEVFLFPESYEIMAKQNASRMEGETGVYEIPLRKKGGDKIWVLISGAPLIEMDGSISGSIGIHYDISRQKRLQEELEEARKKAEAAQEAEKQFLANMSHEIRTPLNAIIGMAHLLFDTNPTEEQREYLDILKSSSEMLRALISDVLDLSKIRSGKLEIQRKEFDMAGLVRSIAKSAQLRLEENPVEVYTDIDPRLNHMVIGDDLLLNQILMNLVGNAEKFTQKGSIKISAKVVSPPGEDPMWVEICIADTGIGIPKEKQEIIFQSFRQVDGDTRRRFGGTGLGLAITHQIVELHGGSIRVESKPGKGAKFIVRLPYGYTNKESGMEIQQSMEHMPLDVQHKLILVAEDNYMNRKYVGTLLRKWTVPFEFAHHGREALEKARLKRYDLILMDIQMPEMDGYETSIAIRQTANLNSKTPIVALTASAMLSHKDKVYAAGMNEYLSKPFAPQQLYEKIQHFLGPELRPAPMTGVMQFTYHPLLDQKLLSELYGDDHGYAREMFEMFLEHTLPEFKRIRELVNEKNWEQVARLTHKLKPAFGMVGLPALEEKMQELELSAQKHTSDALSEKMLAQIEQSLPEAEGVLRADLVRLQNL